MLHYFNCDRNLMLINKFENELKLLATSAKAQFNQTFRFSNF